MFVIDTSFRFFCNIPSIWLVYTTPRIVYRRGTHYDKLIFRLDLLLKKKQTPYICHTKMTPILSRKRCCGPRWKTMTGLCLKRTILDPCFVLHCDKRHAFRKIFLKGNFGPLQVVLNSKSAQRVLKIFSRRNTFHKIYKKCPAHELQLRFLNQHPATN